MGQSGRRRLLCLLGRAGEAAGQSHHGSDAQLPEKASTG